MVILCFISRINQTFVLEFRSVHGVDPRNACRVSTPLHQPRALIGKTICPWTVVYREENLSNTEKTYAGPDQIEVSGDTFGSEK